MRKILLYSIPVLFIILSACRPFGVRGNGNVVVKERKLSGFEKVDVSGIFHVKIVSGEDFGVKVRAEENLLKYIKTEVEGKTLVIYTKRNLSPRKNLQLKITLPELKSIESSGVNKILAKNISTEKFNVDLSGAGKIVLMGECDRFFADISGASNLEAKEFKCNSVNVDVSGASHAIVFAGSSLIIDASGASSVKYYGDPDKVVTDVSGVSSVKRGKED
ncbi:MAG: DUF2807 domain-containing protein [Ignavibacteria bacterium]|nr:MAG: DUF2807 domain-containing protein [Ignavibacteria bacterium]